VRRGETVLLVVGVTGAVAVGKSTLTLALATLMRSWPEALSVEVVSTDGFLLHNAELEARGLALKKGYPESYDSEALRRVLASLRLGPADIPGYSHDKNDVDPSLSRRIAPPDILLVEGLGLQAPEALGLDALLYLEAEERLLEVWFADRFLGFWRAAETDPESFYARFRHMSADEVRALAATVWQRINLPNLRENIVRARDHADWVVHMGDGHVIEAIDTLEQAPTTDAQATD
jgi:type I pantothenate kinase